MGKVIWSAMVGSVAMLGGVILVLHYDGIGVENSGGIAGVILILGLLSILPYPVLRLILNRRKQGDGTVPAHSAARGDGETDSDPQKALRDMLLLAGVAEMPVMMGIVYVALGGALEWGLMLWALSMIAILSVKPPE
jgi:hypothetical protein